VQKVTSTMTLSPTGYDDVTCQSNISIREMSPRSQRFRLRAGELEYQTKRALGCRNFPHCGGDKDLQGPSRWFSGPAWPSASRVKPFDYHQDSSDPVPLPQGQRDFAAFELPQQPAER
jgi:hypothetical protein